MKWLICIVLFFLFSCKTAPLKPTGNVENDHNQIVHIPIDFDIEEVTRYLFDIETAKLIPTNYTITDGEIIKIVDDVNIKFNEIGIQFFVRHINRCVLQKKYNLSDLNRDAELNKDGILVHFFCFKDMDNHYAGLSYLPQDTHLKGIWLNDPLIPEETLAHELGHYFGLRHTFDPDEDLTDTFSEIEWVQISSLPYSNYKNIMNYTLFTPLKEVTFSEQQKIAIRTTLFEYRPELLR